MKRTLIYWVTFIFSMTVFCPTLPGQEEFLADSHDRVTSALGQDLTVEEAVLKAEQNSESILMSRGDVRRSDLALAEAWSRAFPSINLEATGSWMTNPPEGVSVEEGALGTITIPPSTSISLPPEDTSIIEDYESTFYRLNLVMDQPLFTWLKIKNAIDLAGMDLEIARLNLVKAERQVCRDVREAYFSAVLALESRELLEEAQRVLEEVLQDVNHSYEVGLLKWQSVLEVKADLAEIEQQVHDANESYLTALESLALLTGLETSGVRLRTSYRGELPDLDEESLKSEVVRHSLEAEIVLNQVEKARKNLDIATGDALFRPHFSLRVQWELTGRKIPFSSSDWTDTVDQNLTITLGARVPLFDSLSSHWKIRQAEELLSKASIGRDQTEKVLALAVRKAVAEVRGGYYEIRERKARLDEAEEMYRNARVSFKSEVITRQEEGQTRLYLIRAGLEYRLALFRYEMALTELEYLMGARLGS